MTKMMKRNYILLLGAGLMLLGSCSPVHRYGCPGRGRRCIPLSHNETVKAKPQEMKRNA
ncbi:hypothetical protein ACLI09_13535 [Flavobacterium sp. RHBU_24]|uniref:hypothetical protein n=1 Tax=Flavobacterium sp. RHBU_24 TaxID=3391185 RepID=UPI0039846E78